MKLKYLLCGTAVWFAAFSYCFAEDRISNTKPSIESTNLSLIVQCYEFDYRGIVFVNPYSGCTYNPDKWNKFGNISVFLVLKDKSNNLMEEYESFWNKNYPNFVKNLGIKKLKEDFNIYFSLIPQQYISSTAEGPYHNTIHTKELYRYDEEKNKWALIKTYHIDEDQRDTAPNLFDENFWYQLSEEYE